MRAKGKGAIKMLVLKKKYLCNLGVFFSNSSYGKKITSIIL